MTLMIVITSCTAKKMDNVAIPKNGVIVQPKDYITDQKLLADFNQVRRNIFEDQKAKFGKNITYAFDLYVNTGVAYKKLKQNHYDEIKSLLISKKLDWYFLSGGYGIIHALEPARNYQATFNRSISYKNNIPFTGNLWKITLPKIIDQIIYEKKAKRIYTFGSQDYTKHIKLTNFWKNLDKTSNYKIFESRGSAGVHWVSKILDELAKCIELKKIESFDKKYPQFIKQNS
jgi:cytoplasmic iron level regulating protein YaaA (DUF328/UPF0246 family)